MRWRDHSKDVVEGSHAFLGGSKYSWINWTDEELVEHYNNQLAVIRGTKLHAFACSCILLKQRLPESTKTLNSYVNDAIGFRMVPEQALYYSPNAFGTADAISYSKNFLRIHDLKTGKTPASMKQLFIYTALFLLEYDIRFSELDGVELRIYQNDKILKSNPEITDILPIMDKIVTFDRMISNIKEDNYGI